LQSRHSGLALAARLALEHLTEDDSRTVIAAATAALGAQAPPEPPAPPVQAPLAPRPAMTTHRTQAPLTPEPARPQTRPDAAVSEPAPAAAAAPKPATPVRDDPRLQIAGQLALLGAVLVVVGLFPGYQWGDPIAVAQPGVLWYVLTIAAVALSAGVCLLLPHTRWLVGPGLLLGIAAAATWGLMALATEPLVDDGFESGLGLELAACAVLLLGACLAGLALVRAGEIHLVARRPGGAFPWIVAVLGAASAALLALLAQWIWEDNSYWPVVPYILTAVVALVVSAWAAAAVPRRFGAFLLAGWAGGGLAISLFRAASLDHLRRNEGSDVGHELLLVVLFGLVMLALLVVAALVARAERPSQVERTAPAAG
jgi:hypothetical protein